VKKDEVDGACNADRDEEECIKVIGEKTRRKETKEVYSCRWEDNIKVDVREIGGVVSVGFM
jgi:hypothetical protein